MTGPQFKVSPKRLKKPVIPRPPGVYHESGLTPELWRMCKLTGTQLLIVIIDATWNVNAC